MEEIKIGSFFSGIGAFEKALERLEIPHKTVFYCEIDKYASKAYSLIHGVSESLNLWDITKVNEQKLPDFDLMTWGFPCQDISVAGKQKGVIEGKTRSGLYYDGLRILKEKRPKYSIIENVKNLTSEKFRPVFNQILCDLEDAGYHSYYEVLNAKDYGIPQNRERIFIVSIRKDIDQGFMFPLPFDNGLRLKDLLEDEVDEKYYISQEKTEQLLSQLNKGKGIKNVDEPSGIYLHDSLRFSKDALEGESRCLKANKIDSAVIIPVSYNRKSGINKKIDYAYALNATDWRGLNRNQDQNAVVIGNTNPSGHGMNGNVYTGGIAPTITTNKGEGIKILQVGILDIKGNEQIRRVYSEEGLAPTLNCMEGGNRQPKVLTYSPAPELVGGVGEINFGKQYRQGNRIYSADKTAMALMSGPVGNAGGNSYLYYHNYRIRKLTPLECFRLMGFDDTDYWICKNNGISDSQLYKMAGNSIVVNVLEEIFKNLLQPGVNVPGYFCGEQLALFG